MISSKIRERSLCLLNSENLDSSFEPWLTISDVQFHPDVCALYSKSNINPIQSIQTDYLPPFISYLWTLIHNGVHLWAVDHPSTREITPIKFVLKYDLLIWNIFYRSINLPQLSNAEIVYPKVLILAPDWFTCENTYKHLSNVNTDVLKKVIMCCIYEGQNIENDLYKKLLTEGCDLLIATPTIVNDLIQKRHIHFEQLQMIVYDQLDLLLQSSESIREILNLVQLHTNKNTTTQHFLLSRIVNQQTKDFIFENISQKKNYYYLSSSMMETYTYKNNLVYCEPCRNWSERKRIIKETLDLAHNCQKKVLMCAYQTRRLATMQSILNDLSIQSILIHCQLSHDEIEQYIHEWQTINDRPVILLIQDDILNDITIDNTDIIIHLDVQRLIWYQLFNQRMKLVYKHLLNDKDFNEIKKKNFTSLKSIEKYYQLNSSVNIPLIVILWPGDCAQVTYDLIDYLNNSHSFLHPLIERLAKNNCYESIQAKMNVELCPTLKMFGECLNQRKLKRCPYRHHFHYDVDYIEQKPAEEDGGIVNENCLSNFFELYLPNKGEIELRITHISDGNRLWANILRSRNDINQTLNKIFDYDSFDQQIQEAFVNVKNRPLSEIIPGEIYLYADDNYKIHRVYVHEQEQTYFDIRRADSILNRRLKVSNTVTVGNNEQEKNKQITTTMEKNTTPTTADHPALTVFSLDTGITLTLKSNESLFPIEPSSLKQYPPLATEIILCNICPLDKITMTFTSYTIETLRSLTLNETFMGRIKLATRSCLWIDPLVKPVRLAALKRIAYDKPIRKQLILSKLVESNDNHMIILERMGAEAQLHDLAIPTESVKPVESVKPIEPVIKPTEQEPIKEEVIEDFSPIFKPFLNRIGQLIINPVGRSKQFFFRHNQQLHSDFVKPINSIISNENDSPATKESLLLKEEQPTIKTNDNVDRYVSLGRGHKINTETILSDNVIHRPQSIPVSNLANFHHSEEHSSFQTLIRQIPQSTIDTIDSAVTTPSETEPSKMIETETNNEQIDDEEEEEIFEDTVDTIPNVESSIPTSILPSEKKLESAEDDNDQMMFIFGPKLFSQLRQIKDMEDEQRRQADFPVQRNRNRYTRNNNNNNHQQQQNSKIIDQDNPNITNDNEISDQPRIAPNMSRYEPFVGERGPFTQEQIDYKQTQCKTRLFWEQTSRDIYLTIGFYNVDSTQTRVEFDTTSIYCRTKIRVYDRFVRIHLPHEILPEKCLFQVRRSNILLTIRKATEGLMWSTLTDRPIEPRPDFFIVDYGSDDESDGEKRRRTVNHQWEQIREDKRKLKLNNKNDDEKFLIDDIDDDDHHQPQQQQTEKLNDNNNDEDDEDKNAKELTDTSSDCNSTDSDDCYYEDQVPANHIPRGYDEADYDHRFYGQHIRS